MQHYGLNMQGTFTVEVIPFLRDFTLDDIGRFIYVTANDNYYFGTSIDWVQVGLTPKCIKAENMDFGFLHNQINASTILFTDTFLKSKNVSDALKDLSSGGVSFKSNCILSNHLSDDCVNSNHINFGTSENQVGAKDISVSSLLTPNPIDIQTAIQKLERSYMQIVRTKILNTDWDFDFITQTYAGHISMLPITNKYVIVQCYDNNNNMIFPKKLTVDTYYNRIYIYHIEDIELNVVIIG